MRCEYEYAIRKLNPYHDKLGKFTTADGSAAPLVDASFVDGVKGISEEDKEFCKYFLNSQKEKLQKADKRLGIDAEQAFSRICSQTKSGIESLKSKKDKAGKFINAVKEACHDVINEAESAYCHEKLGESIEVRAGYSIDTKVLDFIDGASWAKNNIGSAANITSILGEAENSDEYGWGLHSVSMAGTSIDGNGTCHMILSANEFSEERDTLGTDHSEGFHPKNLTIGQIGAHEYTHAIEVDLANKMSERYFGGNATVSEFAANNHTVSNIIVKKAMEKCGEIGVEYVTKSKLVSEISGYASSSSSEAMAESVGDVYSNGEDAATLSKAVVELLKSDDIIDIVAQEAMKFKWYQDYIPN